MKLTKLQARALMCLYKRARRRAGLHNDKHGVYTCDYVELSAGKGAQPDGQPHDLLRWDRMERLDAFGLVMVSRFGYGHVQLTSLGVREAQRRMDRCD
jgi:hypothetical protein